MLIICVGCRKIIGCGLTPEATIKNECVNCKRYKECIDETPLGMLVERRVYFVHFEDGCAEHETVKIGYRIGGAK